MRDLMTCWVCGDVIVRDHGNAISFHNALMVLTTDGALRVKCAKCGEMQLIAGDLLPQIPVTPLGPLVRPLAPALPN